MSAITTHVLNTALGQPAANVPIVLHRADGEALRLVGTAATDRDGRARDLLPAGVQLEPGDYQLEFDTGAYFRALGVDAFYPAVRIRFTVRDASQHYHVPLLLSPYGYSTYRGS